MACIEMAAPRYSIDKVRVSAVTMDETLCFLNQQVLACRKGLAK
jgi:hypothetical protein